MGHTEKQPSIKFTKNSSKNLSKFTPPNQQREKNTLNQQRTESHRKTIWWTILL